MEKKQQTNSQAQPAESPTISEQETVVPQSVAQQPPEQEIVLQSVVPQTLVQETVPQTVGPQTPVKETVAKPTVSISTAEATVEKTVEKVVQAINHRNNQSQSPTFIYNPSLLLIPRHEPADVISAQRDSSLVNWLESSGRMLPRDSVESDKYTEEEAEISALIAVDDSFNDDDVLDENTDEAGE